MKTEQKRVNNGVHNLKVDHWIIGDKSNCGNCMCIKKTVLNKDDVQSDSQYAGSYLKQLLEGLKMFYREGLLLKWNVTVLNTLEDISALSLSTGNCLIRIDILYQPYCTQGKLDYQHYQH